MSIPKAARNAAYKKHGKKCHHCGTKKNLSLHHKNGRKTDNSVDNLMPLCRGKDSCHSFATDIIDFYKEGCDCNVGVQSPVRSQS